MGGGLRMGRWGWGGPLRSNAQPKRSIDNRRRFQAFWVCVVFFRWAFRVTYIAVISTDEPSGLWHRSISLYLWLLLVSFHLPVCLAPARLALTDGQTGENRAGRTRVPKEPLLDQSRLTGTWVTLQKDWRKSLSGLAVSCQL